MDKIIATKVVNHIYYFFLCALKVKESVFKDDDGFWSCGRIREKAENTAVASNGSLLSSSIGKAFENKPLHYLFVVSVKMSHS